MQAQILNFPVARRVGRELQAIDFATAQRALARFNRTRLAPGLGEAETPEALVDARRMAMVEEALVQTGRRAVAPLLAELPSDSRGFLVWYEKLLQSGPGQNDALFPWLAYSASRDQLRWFLAQEVAGEAGFDDLVAMTQVKMPVRAKLEMARNYWDEMGRGQDKGMHGPMLDRLAQHLAIAPQIETTVAEALALGNMMVALAFNRRYAFHAVGALGAIELTAPSRAVYVVKALDRLGVSKKESHYFSLHASLDVRHSQDWNREVILPLVAEDFRRARPIAEGALLRLWCGQQCFARYRRELGVLSASA